MTIKSLELAAWKEFEVGLQVLAWIPSSDLEDGWI